MPVSPPPRTREPRIPTLAEIENAQSARGGYSRATLAEWGVPWPPPSGWKARLVSLSRERRALPASLAGIVEQGLG